MLHLAGALKQIVVKDKLLARPTHSRVHGGRELSVDVNDEAYIYIH